MRTSGNYYTIFRLQERWLMQRKMSNHGMAVYSLRLIQASEGIGCLMELFERIEGSLFSHTGHKRHYQQHAAAAGGTSLHMSQILDLGILRSAGAVHSGSGYCRNNAVAR